MAFPLASALLCVYANNQMLCVHADMLQNYRGQHISRAYQLSNCQLITVPFSVATVRLVSYGAMCHSCLDCVWTLTSNHVESHCGQLGSGYSQWSSDTAPETTVSGADRGRDDDRGYSKEVSYSSSDEDYDFGDVRTQQVRHKKGEAAEQRDRVSSVLSWNIFTSYCDLSLSITI